MHRLAIAIAQFKIFALGFALGAALFAVGGAFTNCSIQTPEASSASASVGDLDGVYDPNQDVIVTASLPTWNGTTITNLTTGPQHVHMLMNHSTSQLPAGYATNAATCTICHTGTTYYPGVFHSSIIAAGLSAPTQCLDCHTTASHPTGFVGTATDASTNPGDGQMKHDAVVWAPNSNFVYSATGNSVVSVDCASCHVSPSSSTPNTPGDVSLWTTSGGGTSNFHSGIAASGQPTSCIDCHAGSRPASTAAFKQANYTASPFDYVVGVNGVPHGGGINCATCHAGASTPGAGQSFEGGHFTHGAGTPSSVTCIACHTTQRPDRVLGAAAALTAVGFDHSTLTNTQDCFTCHQATVTRGSYTNYYNPNTNTLPGGDWSGGVPL